MGQSLISLCKCVGPKKGRLVVLSARMMCCLSSESVQDASLPLEGVHHVHGGDGLPLGVLGVGDGVADHVLEEDLEDAPGLLVDEAGDPLDAAPPGEAPDGGLGDALGDRRSGRPTDRRLTWMLSRRTLRCLLAPPLPSPLPPLPRPVTLYA